MKAYVLLILRLIPSVASGLSHQEPMPRVMRMGLTGLTSESEKLLERPYADVNKSASVRVTYRITVVKPMLF